IALRKVVIGALAEAGIVDPINPWIVTKELRDLAPILDMSFDSDGKRLDALKEEERVDRCQHRAHRALAHTAAARAISGIAEMVGVDHSMVGRVGLRHHRKAFTMRSPWEATTIDDDPPKGGAVSAHELRQRMHHDIGAVVDRFQQDWSCDSIVDDQGDPVLV